ncbi:TlpA disulfide reductase family protein [Psychroflexus aestuariivivens]|uniref:TlpA disulfide reductase family protein n=1 Tax=Psychroflexus aestuariivivens TaxID=1795040 RepID=UPI000FDC1EA0|nr:TlpA disulfide reductase family protein [Psychroflexus aestuariivivens]
MRILLVLLLAITIVGCEQNEKKLNANIAGVEDGTEVYLAKLGPQNNPEPVDTTTVKNETFSFDLKDLENQEINLLNFQGLNGNVIFITEDQSIEMEVYKDSLNASKVMGGKHNQLLEDYISMLKNFGEKQQELQNEYRSAAMAKEREKVQQLRSEMKSIMDESKEARLKFAKENKNSIVGMMALSDIVNSKGASSKEMKSIYDGYSNEIKDSQLGKMVGEKIAKIGATDVGAEAPKFSGPTPEGETLALEDAMGKLTLIDFWASWCKPCRLENPNIVNVYEDYKDKGFAVIGVSLDKPNKKDAWIKAIEQDNLNWNHVSNLEFWQEPIARKYGVRSIPAAFLIDEDGVIVAKDLRGPALRKKVEEILGEE